MTACDDSSGNGSGGSGGNGGTLTLTGIPSQYNGWLGQFAVIEPSGVIVFFSVTVPISQGRATIDVSNASPPYSTYTGNDTFTIWFGFMESISVGIQHGDEYRFKTLESVGKGLSLRQPRHRGS